MKILLQGFSGHMGQVIAHEWLKQGHQIIGVDIEHPLSLLQDHDFDVMVDFSTPEATRQIVAYALANRKPLIIGTTGLDQAEVAAWDDQATQAGIGIYWLANCLLTSQPILAFLRQVALEFTKAHIEETHHLSKRDTPSGTALRWREALQDIKDVTIVSNRVTMFTYEHALTLESEDETITLVHQCHHKAAYVRGLTQALTKVHTFIGLRSEL